MTGFKGVSIINNCTSENGNLEKTEEKSMKTKTAPVEQAVKAPKGKKAGKVFSIILLILVLLVGITAAVNAFGEQN